MKYRFIIAFFAFFITTILFPFSHYSISAERLYNKAQYGTTAGVALSGGIIAGTFQVVAPWAYVEHFIGVRKIRNALVCAMLGVIGIKTGCQTMYLSSICALKLWEKAKNN